MRLSTNMLAVLYTVYTYLHGIQISNETGMKWGKTKVNQTVNTIHPKDKQLIDVSRKWYRVVTTGERLVRVTDSSTGASHEQRVEYEYISGAHLVVEPTQVSAAAPLV
jgi:hypothetical protein